MGGLIDLTNVTSLEYTINPDFSQVEADVSQINANTTFALYFPERRPFFNEGKDMIETALNTVYTRAINQPLLSTKLIHQGEKQRIYWLSAYDSKTAYLIGGENGSYFGEGGQNFSNILRYQRIFKQGSHLGFLSTNRFLKNGGIDHTFGMSAQFRFLTSYSFDLEWNQSFTAEPTEDWIDSSDRIEDYTVALDGETFRGDGLYFEIERNTTHWTSSVEYEHSSPLYRAPLGFAVNNSVRSLEFFQRYQHFFEDKFIKKFMVGGELELNYNYVGLRKNAGLGLFFYVELDGNISSEFGVSHGFNEEYKAFNAQDLTKASCFIGFSPSEAIRINVFTEIGESIAYNLEDPTVGNSFFIGTFNNFQISDKFRISPSIRYSELRNKTDQSPYFTGYIARTNFNYQFNNNLSFRLVGEYNAFDKKFFVQPLLKWNPNPFTIFYVGGNSGFSSFDNKDRFEADSAQFYLKFQYLIGI